MLVCCVWFRFCGVSGLDGLFSGLVGSLGLLWWVWCWLVSRVGSVCVFLVVVSWLVWFDVALVVSGWVCFGCLFGYVVLESVVVVGCFGLCCDTVLVAGGLLIVLF